MSFSKLPYSNTEVLEFGLSNCRDFQLLSEEKIFEQQRRRTKVRMNLETGLAPNEETESIHSNSIVSETAVEKRTRFSLSQDQESIGTSDNLEAISEAASNHSVASSLDLENENENDNFSDMVSANVSSGRGTPNVSGRDTSSSGSSQHSKNSSDEENEDAANEKSEKTAKKPSRPLLNSVPVEAPNRPNNRDDLEEKFGKFDCKQAAPADETKSLLSDTWSTDVLASDSEAFALDSGSNIPNASLHSSGYNYFTSHQSLQAQNIFQTALERAETASQSDAWSTDVLSSDTERLQEFDLDETGSITRSEDSNTARVENDSDEQSLSGAVGRISDNQKSLFLEDEFAKDGTIKFVHYSNYSVDSATCASTSTVSATSSGPLMTSVVESKNDPSVDEPKLRENLISSLPGLKVEITDYDNFLSTPGDNNLFQKNQSTLNNRMQTLGRLSFDVRKLPMTEEETVSQILPLLKEKKPNTLDKDKLLKNQISLTDILSCELTGQGHKTETLNEEDLQESLIDFDKDISISDNQPKDSKLESRKKSETCSNNDLDLITNDGLINGGLMEESKSTGGGSILSTLEDSSETGEGRKENFSKKVSSEDSNLNKTPDFLFASTGAIPKINKKNTNSNRPLLRNSNSLDEDAVSRNKRGFFKLPNIRSTIREKMKSLKDKKVNSSSNDFSSNCEVVQNGLDDMSAKEFDETSDEILEKYRDKRGSGLSIGKSINSNNRFSNLIQETQPPLTSSIIDESAAFENTKRLFRNVLSRIDVQMLPLSAMNTFQLSGANEKHHIDLIRFVKVGLV